MAAPKMTLPSFLESLKTNQYKDAAAARRAVGKASVFSDEDRTKAKKAIDAKFGPATVKAPAAKKEVAPAAKKAAKPVPAKAPKAPKAAAVQPRQPRKPKATELVQGVSPRVAFAERTIHHVAGAINAVKASGVPAESALEEMNNTLLLSTNTFRDEIHQMEIDFKVAKETAIETAPMKKARAPRTTSTANGVAKTPESLFEGSAPDAG